MSHASNNRRVKQEELRDQLSTGGHLQHVLEMVGKVADENVAIDRDMVERYKVAIATKLKLIGKYLPDLKQVEIEGEINSGRPILIDLSGGKLLKAMDDASNTANS